MTQVIQSRHNEQVKKLRRALARSERTPEGWLAVDSFHLLEEALASGLEVPQVFYTAEAFTQGFGEHRPRKSKQTCDIVVRESGAEPPRCNLSFSGGSNRKGVPQRHVESTQL